MGGALSLQHEGPQTSKSRALVDSSSFSQGTTTTYAVPGAGQRVLRRSGRGQGGGQGGARAARRSNGPCRRGRAPRRRQGVLPGAQPDPTGRAGPVPPRAHRPGVARGQHRPGRQPARPCAGRPARRARCESASRRRLRRRWPPMPFGLDQGLSPRDFHRSRTSRTLIPTSSASSAQPTPARASSSHWLAQTWTPPAWPRC
jgi:hypothetical protein